MQQHDAFQPWLCHAHPAHQGGKPCGFLNTTPALHQGLTVCDSCGCTKIASDRRKDRGETQRRPGTRIAVHL